MITHPPLSGFICIPAGAPLGPSGDDAFEFWADGQVITQSSGGEDIAFWADGQPMDREDVT